MLASSRDTHRPLGRVPVRSSWRHEACLIFCPETAVTQQCVALQSGASHLSRMLIAGQSDSLSRAHHKRTDSGALQQMVTFKKINLFTNKGSGCHQAGDDHDAVSRMRKSLVESSVQFIFSVSLSSKAVRTTLQ